jgi:hypothetical protein
MNKRQRKKLEKARRKSILDMARKIIKDMDRRILMPKMINEEQQFPKMRVVPNITVGIDSRPKDLRFFLTGEVKDPMEIWS